MRIKVGNQWFRAQPGQPIAVELTQQDRKNIANMASDATRYGVFDDSDNTTGRDKLDWLKAD